MARELGEAGADSDADPALDDLHWAYRSGNLIFFVGPGISTAAGLPSRAALVGRLVERARALGAAEDRLAEVQALADKQRIIDAISLAHTILDPAEIAAIIERDLDDQATDKIPDLALALGALRPGIRAVITTNLDRLLERAMGGAWPALSRVTADIAQRRRFILKLHGTLTVRSSWILTRDDLALAPHEDERRRQALAALFNESALLFLGYSVADDDFDNILTRLRAIAGPEPPRHFALVPSEGVTPYRRDRLERSGVRPIPYDNSDGEHREVVRLLRRLARAGGGATEEHISLNPAPISGEVVRRASDSPFPGLTSFDRADARFFFGRDAEIAEATRRLGDTPEGQRRWLSIEGPCGVGKSSLAKAGVVPAIVERGWAFGAPDVWRVAVIRPGSDPLLTLVHSVHTALKDRIPAEGRTPAATAAAIRAQPGALATFLREHTPKGTGLLLVVDQLEELFTIAEPATRAAFEAALGRALADAGGPLYLVTTLRADFAAKVRDLPDLAAIFNTDAVRLDLAEMRRPALRAAIEGPARLANLTWERDLAAQILDDAVEVESPLPLLAYLLHALWIRRQESTLGQGAYDALGGVAGALPKIADALLEGLGKDGRDRAQRLLLALVRITPDGVSRRALTRSEAVLAAGGGDKGERVLARLLGGRDPRKPQGAESPVRLLSASRMREDEEDRIELCHEALLDRWGTLKRWVDERQGQLSDRPAAGGAADRGAPRGWRATAILTAVSLAAAALGGLAAVAMRQRAEAVHARERVERDLSTSENKLGDLAQARGDVAAAREYFEEALALREKLARAAPGDVDLQVDLALSHGRVASAAKEANDADAFQTHWKAAKAILDRIGQDQGAGDSVKLTQAREWIDRIGN